MNDQKAYLNLSLKERIYLSSSNRNKNYLGLNSLAPLTTAVSPLSPPPPPPTPSQIPNSYENLKLSQTSSISSQQQPLVRYSLPVKSHVELDRFADRLVTENRTFFNLTEPNRIQEPSTFQDLKVTYIKIYKRYFYDYLYIFLSLKSVK